MYIFHQNHNLNTIIAQINNVFIPSCIVWNDDRTGLHKREPQARASINILRYKYFTS
jgi:hypothetical protein